jgi:hypothetical protein
MVHGSKKCEIVKLLEELRVLVKEKGHPENLKYNFCC